MPDADTPATPHPSSTAADDLRNVDEARRLMIDALRSVLERLPESAHAHVASAVVHLHGVGIELRAALGEVES
jgi:hypothetical protein